MSLVESAQRAEVFGTLKDQIIRKGLGQQFREELGAVIAKMAFKSIVD